MAHQGGGKSEMAGEETIAEGRSDEQTASTQSEVCWCGPSRDISTLLSFACCLAFNVKLERDKGIMQRMFVSARASE